MLPCPALILSVMAVRFFSEASSCRALSGLFSSWPSVPLPRDEAVGHFAGGRT